MTWVVFSTRAAFDAYHGAQVTAHAIPYPGRRQSDQSPGILSQWTNAWVDIFGAFVASPDSYLLVDVPPADVATFSLTPAQSPPYFTAQGARRVLWDGIERTVLTVAQDWRQPKPATYTMDGITYNTTTGQPV